MDSVEGAALLCISKLACSLVFLPSLTASYSPVSFCCCCLLIFTDFLVTVFLSFLCIFESWVTVPTLQGEVIALRLLLFLSHTYAAVLLLLTPVIAVETMIRLLWPQKRPEKDGDKLPSHVLGYFCCLVVWVVVALKIWWRWKRHEEWAFSCLHTTNSLIRCLPTLLSPLSSTVNPWWGIALLLVFLITNTGLNRQRCASAETGTHQTKCGRDNSDSCWQDLVVAQYAPSEPEKSGMAESAQSVDPEKTENSCSVHRTFFWNVVQMLARNHGDFVLIFPKCLSAERGGQAQERTKSDKPLTEGHVEPQYRNWSEWWDRVFPCLRVNIIIRCVCVLSIFVLPLNLSVNIFLIRTIEALSELWTRFFVLPVASNTSVSDETLCVKVDC